MDNDLRLTTLETQIATLLPHLATKADIAEMHGRTDAKLADLRADTKADFHALETSMEKLRGDMHKGMETLRGEMHKGSADVIKWFLYSTLTTIVSLTAIMNFMLGRL